MVEAGVTYDGKVPLDEKQRNIRLFHTNSRILKMDEVEIVRSVAGALGMVKISLMIFFEKIQAKIGTDEVRLRRPLRET